MHKNKALGAFILIDFLTNNTAGGWLYSIKQWQKSFGTEIENPVVAKDIIDLEQKIFDFKNNNIDEEKFRSLRLARGVYGQRQQGVPDGAN